MQTPEQASRVFDDHVIPVKVEEFKESSSRVISTAGSKISHQHLPSDADSGSREDEIRTKSPAEIVVSEADVTHEGEVGLMNGYSKKNQDDGPEVMSRTFEFLASQGPEKSKSILMTKKLTVDVSWEKLSSDDSESDQTVSFVACPNTPVCFVMPRTITPNVSSTVYSQEDEMSGRSFGDANEAGSKAAGDGYEQQNAETQMEDSKNERICSRNMVVIAYNGDQNQVSSEDDSASAVSAKEDITSLPANELDEDELQEDLEYFTCEYPSVFHKETENGTEDSDSDSVYEDTHENAEAVLNDYNACPSAQSKFSKEVEETARDSEDAFEELLPYLELDHISTTPSMDVPDADA
ncbi:hypothetical protein R1sor_001688 [Riccia sorocarpa]|uniref:Uncharacterized protein n=1 Tax=Riccia sorocarpa TaxID=122646 RepID=A0ABD3H0V5_9MARC